VNVGQIKHQVSSRIVVPLMAVFDSIAAQIHTTAMSAPSTATVAASAIPGKSAICFDRHIIAAENVWPRRMTTISMQLQVFLAAEPHGIT
jgi:hypothetical protein